MFLQFKGSLGILVFRCTTAFTLNEAKHDTKQILMFIA